MILPVTVCIPVKNEELNLPSCLRALGSNFPEMVVIDSGSKDRTREIAEGAGAKVLDFNWNGKFPKKRNWALQNYEFKTPWVLFLDADERVTPEFVSELSITLEKTPHVGFWISFTNWFMDQPLRHGDTFRKLALFRVGAGEYECFPEDSWSHLDMEVHEHPVLEGSLGDIRAKLEHHDFRGMEHYFAKHDQYSNWEANRFHWLQSASPQEWNKLNQRQRFKYRNLDKWWLGWAYWFVAYMVKKGFLDGRAGWIFNGLKRQYFSDIRMKILEKQR